MGWGKGQGNDGLRSKVGGRGSLSRAYSMLTIIERLLVIVEDAAMSMTSAPLPHLLRQEIEYVEQRRVLPPVLRVMAERLDADPILSVKERSRFTVILHYNVITTIW